MSTRRSQGSVVLLITGRRPVLKIDKLVTETGGVWLKPCSFPWSRSSNEPDHHDDFVPRCFFASDFPLLMLFFAQSAFIIQSLFLPEKTIWPASHACFNDDAAAMDLQLTKANADLLPSSFRFAVELFPQTLSTWNPLALNSFSSSSSPMFEGKLRTTKDFEIFVRPQIAPTVDCLGVCDGIVGESLIDFSTAISWAATSSAARAGVDLSWKVRYRTFPWFFSQMSKLYKARSLLYRRQILQENIRWKALDEIYKIYMFLHRSDLNISAKFRQFFRIFCNVCKMYSFSKNFHWILLRFWWIVIGLPQILNIFENVDHILSWIFLMQNLIIFIEFCSDFDENFSEFRQIFVENVEHSWNFWISDEF